jgi:WD40 repeat protein
MIALCLKLLVFILFLYTNAISCVDYADSLGYMMTCASSECQEAISYCVNTFKCLGIKPCQKCLSDYPQCENACGSDLFDDKEYITIKYLPCDQSSQEQVAACELHCRGLYFTSSQCTRVEGFPVCKCSNNISLQMSSTTTTKTSTQTTHPETTTESTTVTSTLPPWNDITLEGHSYWVNCIITLNNGDFASGSADRTIIIWDSVTFSIKRVLNNTSWVTALFQFSNDDLASASADQTIKIWDPQSGALKMTLANYKPISLAILNDGSLASGNLDLTIKIWDPTTGQLKKTLNDLYGITSLAVMSNGYLASVDLRNRIKIWDTITGYIKYNISNSVLVTSLKFLKNGDLATKYSLKSNKIYGIQIRDPESFVIKANYIGHSDYVHDLVELPNGDLASASSDTTVKIWDRATGNVKKTLSLHTNPVLSLAILKDGLLASGSNKTIVISKV